MFKIRYTGEIRNGKFVANFPERLKQQISTLEGREVILTLGPKLYKRTKKQNSLYWVYVNILADHFGYDSTEMHEIIKYELLRVSEYNEATGREMIRLRSTTSLSTLEYKEFLDRLKVWASMEFGVDLPDAGEQLQVEYASITD